jgi:hypothetical protein
VRIDGHLGRAGPRGYDGGTTSAGRERHLIVDPLGLLRGAPVAAANLDDGTRAPKVLARLTAAHRSRWDEIRGDSTSNHRALDRHLATARATYTIPVVERPPGVTGSELLPDR